MTFVDGGLYMRMDDAFDVLNPNVTSSVDTAVTLKIFMTGGCAGGTYESVVAITVLDVARPVGFMATMKN